MIELLVVVKDQSFDYDWFVFEVHPVASALDVEQALQGQKSISFMLKIPRKCLVWMGHLDLIKTLCGLMVRCDKMEVHI